MKIAELRNKSGSLAFRLLVLASLGFSLTACQSSSSSSASLPAPSSSSSPGSASSSSASSSSSGSSSGSSTRQSPASSSQSGSNGQRQSPGSSSAGSSGSQSSASSASPGQEAGQSGRDGPTPAAGQSSSSQSQQGSQATTGAAGFPADSAAGSPGQAAGSQARLPGQGDQTGTGRSRDGSTGEPGSGASRAGNGGLGQPGGDYSLDTLPDGVLSGRGASSSDSSQVGNGDGNSTTQATGAMTAAERADVLDERLRRGYETFDGFILGERERAQAESNAAGSSVPGGTAAGGGGGNSSAQPQTIPQPGSPSTVLASSQPQAASAPPANETFAPPEDIPSGRDDDVVARQLREAAMSEPDAELREALWQEYRNYTGLGEDQ